MLDQVTVPALAFDGSFNFMPNFSRHTEDRCCPGCAPHPSAPLCRRDKREAKKKDECPRLSDAHGRLASPVNTRTRDILHGRVEK